jgi:hypothetical protein
MQDGASFNSDISEPMQPGPSGYGLLRGFLGTARAVLLSPRKFFPSMPVEGGLLGPYIFFFLCTTFSFLVSLVLILVTGGEFSPWTIVVMLAALGMPFFSAAILTLLFTKLLRTGGTYEATFRVICYASAVNLFAWIPDIFVILLFQFYEIYLSALGLSVVHRTSLGQALLVVIGTLLTVSVTMLFMARVFFSF